MGWFWADGRRNNSLLKHSNVESDVRDDSSSLCPVMHGDGSRKQTDDDTINPFNRLPNISPTEKQSGQSFDLTTERTISSIPKGSDNQKWEYPSAQQMYNAMLRKGKIDSKQDENVAEDTIEAMVQVHNFLNESCWYEVLRWEKEHTENSRISPKLLNFMGKPGQLSPRARLHYYMSYIFPNYFARELPFDRHDWIVLRGEQIDPVNQKPKYKKIRYVLDFYGGPDDENGMPTFSVDVRPALDNITNVRDRFHYFIHNNSFINRFRGPGQPTESSENKYTTNNSDNHK